MQPSAFLGTYDLQRLEIANPLLEHRHASRVSIDFQIAQSTIVNRIDA